MYMGTLGYVLFVDLPASPGPDTVHLTCGDAPGDTAGMGVPDSPTTRVLLVEDQRTLAEALMIAIDAQPDLLCVGAVDTAEEALRLIRTRSPDVVLMDIHLPGLDGLAGTRQIKTLFPDVRVFILTADATPEMYSEATAAGAMGFLAKDGPFPDILAAIRTPPKARAMVAGGTFAVLMTDRRRDPRAHNWAALTEREREVLELMGEELDTRRIAERLGVSTHTARSHIKRVLAKLHAHSRQEAVGVALRTGLIPGKR
jgi:DNA-binding NarL/FixJ family response regulator